MSDDWVKNLTYISHVVPISAEEYRLRTEGPTEAERAEWALRAAEREAADQAQRDHYDHIRLDAAGYVRAVMDLHAPKEGVPYWCEGCDSGLYAEDYPDWPCSTAALFLPVT